MTDIWNELTDREKLEFLKMRNQYPDYMSLSRKQFLEQFLDIWRATGRGQVTKDNQK